MSKFVKIIIFFTFTGVALLAVALSGAYLYLAPGLPDAEKLADVKLQVPLRIYSSDGKLLGEFGEKKRTPVKIRNVPPLLIKAFLAAEDDRFYKHKGFSTKGLSRAVWQAVSGSDEQTGGSTITMQVAKNYFLSPERSVIRKLKELFLSVQIERFLTKDQILELYLNYIFLGHQSYGIVAAAHVYYGKSLDELTLEEMATIAGLPKAPSAFNPIINPDRALERRNWILQRMLNLGFIDQPAYEKAVKAPIATYRHKSAIELDASYAAEMARLEMIKMYGEEAAYTEGYRVVTTIDSHLQETAQASVRHGLHDYDWRHGYRKPEAHLDKLTADTKKAAFNKFPSGLGLETAIVTDNQGKSVKAELADGQQITIGWEGSLATAKKYISESRISYPPKTAKDIVSIGDVIRVRKDGEKWQLTQIPKIEAALISMNPNSGALYAIVGGYGFYNNKFNRATQARRLVGSNIKPFIYSLALQNGYTAATMINDSPIVYRNPWTGAVWQPKNDDDEFNGPTRFRQCLYRSRNICSVRILQSLGVKKTVEYLTHFGFEKNNLPQEMSLALGTASFRPIQVVTGYATFANQGFKINPYLIDAIYDRDNKLVYKASPAVVCKTCEPDAPLPVTDPSAEGQPSAADNPVVSGDAKEEADSMEELLGDKQASDKQQSPAVDESADMESLMAPSATDENPHAPRILDKRTAFIIDSILTDTIQKGTARKALSLQRNDIAGKTATTNGPTDSWFSGYHPNIITTVWSGFDDNTPLGKDEYGSTIALPIWIEYMEVALKDQPEMLREPPPGIVSVLINKTTGKRTTPGDADSMFEYIQEELLYKLGPVENQATETTQQIESLF